MTWQPIETAPKDRIIFLGSENYAEYYCMWHKNKWCYWGIDGFDGMNWVGLDWPPSHWMDLPPNPSRDSDANS